MKANTAGPRALPGPRLQPSDFGVPLGDLHFMAPMASPVVPSSESGFGACD